MSEIARADRDGPFLEIRDALTRKEAWLWLLGLFAVFVVAVRLPFVWEFSLLCCITPAPLFCYGTVRSGVIHQPGITKVLVTIAALHCLLITSTLYLWKKSPKSINGDFGWGFIAIEVTVIALLMWFTRKRIAWSTRRSSDRNSCQ